MKDSTPSKPKMTDDEIMLFNEELMAKINKRKIQLLKEPPEVKIMNDLIKIHIYLCQLIQHHLTPEIKADLKEYIKSWLLMLEE